MIVGGLPEPLSDHAAAVAAMALDMQQEIQLFRSADGQPCRIRIGIHTGPVVAGVIGTKKFSYDLWGDTVNIASRLESHGVPGQIHVSAATYERLHGRFEFSPPQQTEIKGRGTLTTYFLLAPLPSPVP
jgi:class 3 adenylate cyclase